MTAQDDGELFGSSSSHEELATAFSLDVREFVELFGAGWRESSEPPHGHDADPAGGMPSLFRPWYMAGNPPQIMLRPHDQAFDLAVPDGRWTQGTHGLAYEPGSTRTVSFSEWDRSQTVAMIAGLLKKRRSTFRYCRYCRNLTPPELRTERDVCMGCAGVWQGVVF